MITKIRVYTQEGPKDWLRENPNETYRCDIYAGDGSDHHGVGRTEAEAILRAAQVYDQRTNRKMGILA